MPDLDDSLLQVFLTGSSELIDQLDQALVALESAPAAEQGEICSAGFRALHTIKGAAGFLGIEPVTECAHAAEAALNRLRKDEVAVSPAAMDLLQQSAEVVRRQIEQLAEGCQPAKADDGLIASLRRLAEGAGASDRCDSLLSLSR